MPCGCTCIDEPSARSCRRDDRAMRPRCCRADELFVHRASGSLAVVRRLVPLPAAAEHGGMWVDTDVVCLRPFDHAGRRDLRLAGPATINNAVLGLPQSHALARWMVACCEQPNRFLPYDSLRDAPAQAACAGCCGQRPRRRSLGRDWAGRADRSGASISAARTHALPFWHFYPIHYLNWHTIFDRARCASAPA